MANFLLIAASSAIGMTTAKILAAQGHKLFLTSRTEEKIADVAQGLRAPYAVLEATDFTAVNAVFEQALQALGSLDGVVNFAGSLLLKPAHLTSAAQYQQVIDASLTTAFAVTHAAGKYLTSVGGSVVLISSSAALTGIPNHEAIAAAKGGIAALVRSAAATYAHQKLRFNAIAPGLTETTLTNHLVSDPQSRKISTSMHPLNRIGTTEDIAKGIVFLLDPENSWITGQVLAIDGGLSDLKLRIKI